MEGFPDNNSTNRKLPKTKFRLLYQMKTRLSKEVKAL